jgi:hypothetical protein
VALGSYPTMSLSDARRKADERRRFLRDGVTSVAKRIAAPDGSGSQMGFGRLATTPPCGSSAPGTSRYSSAMQNSVAIGVSRTSTKPHRSSTRYCEQSMQSVVLRNVAVNRSRPRRARKSSDFPKLLLTWPPNHLHIFPRPVPPRGVSGSSETRGGMRWTRQRQA